MTDIRLPPGGLVGDDPEAVRLGPGARGRRHRDQRPAGSQTGSSYPSSQTGAWLTDRSESAFAVSIADPPPTATTIVPSVPKAREGGRSALDGRRARVRLDLGEQAALDPCRRQDLEHPIDDARATNTRVGDDKRARPAGSRDELGQVGDRAATESGHGRRRRSRWPSGAHAGPRTSMTSSRLVSRRTVSQRRQPASWNQRSVVHAVGVLEHPDHVEVAVVVVGRSSPGRGELAAEAELVDRSAAAVRAVDARASAGPRRALVGHGVIARRTGRARTGRSGRACVRSRSARPSARRRPGSP